MKRGVKRGDGGCCRSVSKVKEINAKKEHGFYSVFFLCGVCLLYLLFFGGYPE